MTVDELRQRMSAEEFMRWNIWHGRRAQQQELAGKAAAARGRRRRGRGR